MWLSAGVPWSRCIKQENPAAFSVMIALDDACLSVILARWRNCLDYFVSLLEVGDYDLTYIVTGDH